MNKETQRNCFISNFTKPADGISKLIDLFLENKLERTFKNEGI
jgi:hypothetical protein